MTAMDTCPYCRRTFQVKAEPYNYRGMFDPWIELILAGLRRGEHPRVIADRVLQLDRDGERELQHYLRSDVTARIAGIAYNYGFKFHREDRAVRDALGEHAFLLRCEGLLLHDIAMRIGGVSKERARQRVSQGARRLAKAMKRTKFRWENVDGQQLEFEG